MQRDWSLFCFTRQLTVMGYMVTIRVGVKVYLRMDLPILFNTRKIGQDKRDTPPPPPPPPPSPNHFVPLANEDSTIKRALPPTFSPCLRIDLPVLFMTCFCRDILCRHGSHVIRDLLRLYCRYLCLHMSLIGVRALTFLVCSHLFLVPCLVDLSCISPEIKTRPKRPPPPSPNHLISLANEDCTITRFLAPKLLAYFSSCLVDFYLCFIPLLFSFCVAFSIHPILYLCL